MPLRKIILAPDSFKESLSAAQVASAMAAGVERVSTSIVANQCPIADGGEGTLSTLAHARNGRLHTLRVTGPMGNAVDARYALVDDGRVGLVEMAEASGLALVPAGERDPSRATSFGTGELIHHLIRAGCREIIVGIGGSATVDGGTGIAQACGFRFFNRVNAEINVPMDGGMLGKITRIEPPAQSFPRIRIACDVTNPLCGPNGAAAVYGPQKGATAQQVRLLDDGLVHLARIAGGAPHAPDAPGAGAAGGAGFGLVTFLGATLERGIELVLEFVGFRDLCRGADLVITGEGRLDAQSLQGKACMGVARAAAELAVPTIAIVGSTGPGAEQCLGPNGLLELHSLVDRFGSDRAMQKAGTCLAQITEEVVRSWIAQRRTGA